jgi:hypothetical protein
MINDLCMAFVNDLIRYAWADGFAVYDSIARAIPCLLPCGL